MSKATKISLLCALAALGLIVLAMLLRYASRHILHAPIVNHLRSGIYVFLFSAWCYTLWLRIVQVQVRRYLLAISALMVLWILLRSIKFSIGNTDAERRLWYFYYFPMLFIPMLSVFVSQSLGKDEAFRLPRWTKLLYIPTLLLLLLVLTNDLHRQVFSFPSGVLSDGEYRYEKGYYFVLGWEALCAAFSLVLMVRSCRIPHSRRIRWLPLVPFALSLAYAYGIKGKKYFEYPSKYYCTDIGLRNARLNFRQQEETHIMENIIYNELLCRDYSVDVGVVEISEYSENKHSRKQCEIDFVVKCGPKKYYIQSALNVSDPAKMETELRPLKNTKDFFKKIIISKSSMKPWTDDYGILHLGLYEFLLNENSLEL